MTLPTDPENPPTPLDDRAAQASDDESAFEQLPPIPLQRRGPPERTRGGLGPGGLVVTAVLAAALAAGGTFGIVELGGPAVGPAPTNAPAQLTSSSTAIPVSAGAANQPIVKVAATVRPAVVTISASGSAGGNAGSSIGSGMIVTSDGFILTNRHVIATGGTLTVQLPDGRQFPGTVVGTDPSHDLAVVKISAKGLPTVTLGNSDTLQLGQLAIAIGDPQGTFAGSVTHGVVSGTGRSIDVQDAVTGAPVHLSGLIQTDAAINEGNSGGPLLNAAGQVIGITTATNPNAARIGFAVPINTAIDLLTQAEAGKASTN